MARFQAYLCLEILLEILLKHLPSLPSMWRGTTQDAVDGSRDQILVLPAELCEQLGWNAGDTLSITKSEVGEIVLRRVE